MAARVKIRGVIEALHKRVRTKSGTIFCQVDRMRQFIQETAAITPGNQLWAGGIPSFKHRLARSKVELNIGRAEVLEDIEIAAVNKITDPVACVRKYLIPASVV